MIRANWSITQVVFLLVAAAVYACVWGEEN